MPKMDFSSAAMEDLRVPEFKNEQERDQFLEAMYGGDIPVPIILQAMGVDFTDEGYVAEGIRLRFIATLSAAAPGFRIVENDMSHLSRAEKSGLFLDANDQRSTEQADYVHERHPLGILGGNVMKKLTGFNRSMDAYGRTKKVKILAGGAGILDAADLKQMQQYPWMEIMPIVSSSTAARWTLRVAKQIGMKIRMLLVELPQFAGGHLGASNAEAAVKAEDFDPAAIREAIRKFAPDTPVVLAGGIAYRDQIIKALQMGYQGVGIGIRGLFSKESKLSDRLIMEVGLNPDYEVVTTDESPTGYPGRYLKVRKGTKTAEKLRTMTPEERIAYVQHAIRNCISCIEPGSCLFIKNAGDPEDYHFCIGQDLPRTRFGKDGGTFFTSTERDRLMYDPIFFDENGDPRVPSLEENTTHMVTHDAPPWPERDADGNLPDRKEVWRKRKQLARGEVIGVSQAI